MNWQEELVEMFQDRKTDHRIENYLKAKNEVILPTFKLIKDLLHDSFIDVLIDNSKDELKVVAYGFVVKTENIVDNIKISFNYLDPNEPNEMPPIKENREIVIAINELSSDLIGQLFVKELKSLKDSYKSSDK